MSIIPGFKRFKRYLKTEQGYQLISHWTSSQSVYMDDGDTLQNTLIKHKTSADHDGRYYTEDEVNNLLNQKSNIQHSSTAATYGVGTSAVYGHVKLSDAYNTAVGYASNAIGASQMALYNAYTSLNTSKAAANHPHNYLPLSGGTITGNTTFKKNMTVEGQLDAGECTLGAVWSNGVRLLYWCLTGSDMNYTVGMNSTCTCFQPYVWGATSEICNGSVNLGSSNHKWKNVYATNGSISTSDRKQKHDIKDINVIYEQLFMKLQPKSFIFNDGDRVHIGAISQDVEDAMSELGITPEQFAGFCKDIRYEYTEFNSEGEPIESSRVPVKDKDGNIIYDYSLRYQEFIFLTIHMVQKLINRLDDLEKRITALELAQK